MWSMSQQGIIGALNNMREDNNMKIVQQLLPCLGDLFEIQCKAHLECDPVSYSIK